MRHDIPRNVEGRLLVRGNQEGGNNHIEMFHVIGIRYQNCIASWSPDALIILFRDVDSYYFDSLRVSNRTVSRRGISIRLYETSLGVQYIVVLEEEGRRGSRQAQHL